MNLILLHLLHPLTSDGATGPSHLGRWSRGESEMPSPLFLRPHVLCTAAGSVCRVHRMQTHKELMIPEGGTFQKPTLTPRSRHGGFWGALGIGGLGNDPSGEDCLS